MKFKLIALSATLLLLGGCSTTFNNYYGNFKSECRNLPENYINQEYIEEYKKSKTIFFEGTDNRCVDICPLLSKRERWDYIEVFLTESTFEFPFENKNRYQIYRDYEFKNCIKNYSNVSENKFKNSSGAFCLAANVIKKRTADYTYSQNSNIKYKTETSKIRETVTSIKYRNKDIIKVQSFSFNSPSMHDSCSIEDAADTIIWKDFSY